MIGGVASGMADAFRIDVTVMRVIWVVAAIASAGIGVAAYLDLLDRVPERRAARPDARDAPSRPRRRIRRRDHPPRHRPRDRVQRDHPALPPRRERRVRDDPDRGRRSRAPVPPSRRRARAVPAARGPAAAPAADATGSARVGGAGRGRRPRRRSRGRIGAAHRRTPDHFDRMVAARTLAHAARATAVGERVVVGRRALASPSPPAPPVVPHAFDAERAAHRCGHRRAPRQRRVGELHARGSACRRRRARRTRARRVDVVRPGAGADPDRHPVAARRDSRDPRSTFRSAVA